MNHIVEVRYNGGDRADLMADMRSWLDRRQIEADEFGHSVLPHGIVVRVGFSGEEHAAAFATAFSGRLERTAADKTAGYAREMIVRPAGADASTSEDLTTSDDAPTESAQPAVKAGVSLMITRRQKADLRERGYSDERIRHMKPEEAHRVLGLIEQQPPSMSAGRRRSPR